MRIGDLGNESPDVLRAAAAILLEVAGADGPWEDKAAALEEVHACLGRGFLARAHVDDDETVAGWCAAQRVPETQVWSIHRLVVKPGRQRQGVGRALLADLEACLAPMGGTTIWVSAPDLDGGTSLGGVDLLPDLLASLRSITNRASHPYEFFLRTGFALAGIIPDAHGAGRPSILLAKRVERAPPVAEPTTTAMQHDEAASVSSEVTAVDLEHAEPLAEVAPASRDAAQHASTLEPIARPPADDSTATPAADPSRHEGTTPFEITKGVRDEPLDEPFGQDDPAAEEPRPEAPSEGA